MILEFSTGNFRSINTIQKFSFRAANIKSEQIGAISGSSEGDLLKGCILYGANGSGKSNMITALNAMMGVVQRSFIDEDAVSNFYEPFLRIDGNSKIPSYFQLIFIIDGKKYRYGFEIGDGRVQSEWLYGQGEKNQVKYFTRKEDDVSIGNTDFFKEGLGIDFKANLKRENLALNLIAAFKGEISNMIKHRIFRSMAIDRSLNPRRFRDRSIKMIKEGRATEVLYWMMEIDPDWRSLELDTITTQFGEKVHVFKEKTDTNGNMTGYADFDLSFHESAGTNKYFNYRGAIEQCFTQGGLFVVDEIDAHLHPLLVRRILEQFHDPKINRTGAQYLFVTHDTNLLDPDLLRRDQIYFSEKTPRGETIVYSLSDLKGIREQEPFAKNYIQGKYGAIPYFGELRSFMKSDENE